MIEGLRGVVVLLSSLMPQPPTHRCMLMYGAEFRNISTKGVVTSPWSCTSGARGSITVAKTGSPASSSGVTLPLSPSEAATATAGTGAGAGPTMASWCGCG